MTSGYRKNNIVVLLDAWLSGKRVFVCSAPVLVERQDIIIEIKWNS